MREAFHLLKEGVASARDIDTARTDGPKGFVGRLQGRLKLQTLAELDTWQRVFESVAPDLDQSVEAPEIIRELV